MEFLVAALLALSCCPALIQSHGYLARPPGRSSVWRRGNLISHLTPEQLNSITNYDDNELFCGGAEAYEVNGYRCGECGDNFVGARKNQPGPDNKYAQGIIGAAYEIGQVIDVDIQITANHLGYFEFRLCAVNDPNTRATQACLDQHLLTFADTGLTRFILPDHSVSSLARPFSYRLTLPPGLNCTQCVLQWRYFGNLSDELFQNCADISIGTGTGTEKQPTPAPLQPDPQPQIDPTQNEDPTTTPTATNAPTSNGIQVCEPTEAYASVPNMLEWCILSCNADPPNCPSSHCTCS